MKVTSKGQVTIPLEIRRQLGIEPGSEVEFTVHDGAARLVRRRSAHGRQIVAAMGGRRLSMTTDEIMALTRDDS